MVEKRRKSGYKLQFCISAVNRELKAPFCKLANFLLQSPSRFRKWSSRTWKTFTKSRKSTSGTRNLMAKSRELAIVTRIEESSLCLWLHANLESMVEKRRKSGYKLQFCFARCNRELKAPFCKLANLLLQSKIQSINQTSHFSIDERLHADRTFWKVSYCRQWMLELDRTRQNFYFIRTFLKAEA